ncbi:MAG: hypothetical protein V3W41_22290 [Planctomycetota bacterium]
MIVATAYYDASPDNPGWAWRCEDGPVVGSGPLEGYETEDCPSRDEAREIALQVVEICQAEEVTVYWRGDSDPVVFSGQELS